MQPRQSQGQIACAGCRVTLAYPLGAPSVRCPMCSTVTPIAQIHVSCVCCRTVLMLPANTTLAMCPRCRTVMNIPSSARNAAGGGGGGPSGSSIKRPPVKKVVYIEGPSLKGPNGKSLNNMAVGTKVDDDPV